MMQTLVIFFTGLFCMVSHGDEAAPLASIVMVNPSEPRVHSDQLHIHPHYPRLTVEAAVVDLGVSASPDDILPLPNDRLLLVYNLDRTQVTVRSTSMLPLIRRRTSLPLASSPVAPGDEKYLNWVMGLSRLVPQGVTLERSVLTSHPFSAVAARVDLKEGELENLGVVMSGGKPAVFRFRTTEGSIFTQEQALSTGVKYTLSSETAPTITLTDFDSGGVREIVFRDLAARAQPLHSNDTTVVSRTPDLLGSSRTGLRLPRRGSGDETTVQIANLPRHLSMNGSQHFLAFYELLDPRLPIEARPYPDIGTSDRYGPLITDTTNCPDSGWP